MGNDEREGTRRDDEWVRCFRCGQIYPREHVRQLQDECPAAFRRKDLCSLCVEVVRGKKGGSWWAEAYQTKA